MSNNIGWGLKVFAQVDGPHLLHAGHYLQEDAPEEILAHLVPFLSRLRQPVAERARASAP